LDWKDKESNKKQRHRLQRGGESLDEIMLFGSSLVDAREGFCRERRAGFDIL
jgi:hypothetical protein